MKFMNIFRLLALVAFQFVAVCAHAASPTIAPLADETTYVDHPILVELPVHDAETPTNLLTFRLSTTNPTLVNTNKNVLFRWFTDGGVGYIPRWYMTLAPTFGLTGTATNTITVSDGTNTASSTFVLTVTPPPANATRFANTNAITLPNSGVASQYPSTINVSGMLGTITNIVVTFSHLTHTNPNDLHMLLVSPTGQKMVFWSKVGGGGPLGGTPPDHHVTNITATITDAAPDWSPLPEYYYIWTEKFRPGDYATIESPANNFPAPAPGGPYPAVPVSNAFHSVFNGLAPNGTWSLYIYDDASPYAGRIDNGWSLMVMTSGPQPPTITDIANQATLTSTPTAPLPFTITDADTPVGSLVLSNASSNPTLVPTNNIVFGGSGSNRTVTVTPVTGLTGTANITIFVSDGTNVASDTFQLAVLTPQPQTLSFTNSAPITILDNAAGSPYPSTINVAGMIGTISNVTVTLRNFSHTWGADTDVLLVGPAGQKMILMSDVCTGAVNNVTLTLSDAAASLMPNLGLTSGTYRPTNIADGAPVVDNYPAPAPAGPYGAALSVFTNTAPNGTWSLYVVDDGAGDSGSFTGGWSLTVSTVPTGPKPPTITDIANQTTVTNTPTAALAFTINDTDTPIGSLTLSNASSNPTLVPTNNIVFGGSGSNRTVTVTPAGGLTGTANISIFVSDGTNVVGDTFLLTVLSAQPQTFSFTNTAAIAILDNSAASPYPSTINVTGMIGTISNVTVTLHSFSHQWARDVDVLLVGPYGQKVMFMSDAGTTPTPTGTFTFSDSAAGFLPATGALAGGTYRPTDYTNLNFVADVMPVPAPTGPYATNLSAFVGQVANGVWSLYVADDGGGDTGSIAGGWSMAISTQPDPITNAAPTLSAISNQVTLVNTPTTAIPFTIGDEQTAASNLVLRAFTSNAALVPTNQIVFGGSGSNRTVTVTPTSNQLGSATISLTVSDGSLTASNSFVLTVNPAPLTVTENSASRGYGATNPVLSGSVIGLQAGDNITASFASVANTNSPVGAYPITFTLSDPGNKLGNYVITTNNGALTVTNALLTVAANNTNKVYGATLNPVAFTATGLLNSDSVSSVTLSSAGSISNASIGSYAITASGALGTGLGNYLVSYASGTLTVNPATLTVTANNTNKAYGTVLNPTSYAVTGLLNGDSVTNVTLTSFGSVSNAPVGSYAINASGALGAGLANYTIGYNGGILTVSAASLTITAGNTNKVYGATLNPIDYSAVGLLNGDSVTNVTLTSAGSVSNAPVGGYAINASGALGAGLTNYTIGYNSGTLTVGAASLTITAGSTNKVYGVTLNPEGYSVVGLLNGDSVTNVTLTSSGSVGSAPVGSYAIDASGASGAGVTNYTIGYNSGVLTVGAASLTITADATNKVYGVTLNPVGYSALGLLNGDSVTNVTLTSAGSISNAPTGSYVINASGALGVGLTNYTVGYNGGILTVGAANLLITAGSTNKVYGATLNPAVFTVTGLLNSDSVTNVALASAGSVSNASAGSYAITASAAEGAGLTNYNIGYSNGTLTIAQAVLVATADNHSRAYGQPNPVFTISYTGFVNGESTNVLDVLPTASSSATITSTPGSHVISTVGGTDNNYVFSHVDGSLTITAPGQVVITSIAFLSPTSLRIAGAGDANVNYKVLASTNLSDWVEIGTALANGSGEFEYADGDVANHTARYYRVATP